MVSRAEKAEYRISHQGDRLLILTNWNTLDFRLMETPVDRWVPITGRR